MGPILFFPGARGSALFWSKVAERLDVRSTRLGWPGLDGNATDASVHTLRDLVPWSLARAPAGAFDLVAQSMGCVVAMLLALEHPERVRRLVLCAPSGGFDVVGRGGADWRAGAPPTDLFASDRTDLTERPLDPPHEGTVIYGDEDPIAPEPAASFLARAIPGASLVCVAGGDHVMADRRPDELAAILRARLA